MIISPFYDSLTAGLIQSTVPILHYPYLTLAPINKGCFLLKNANVVNLQGKLAPSPSSNFR